jgi:formylglycine-generating enzyme required for sulfatase activity
MRLPCGAGTAIGFNGKYLFWDQSFGAEPGKITVDRTFTRTRYTAASFGVAFRNSKSPIALWTHDKTGETISIQNGNNLTASGETTNSIGMKFTLLPSGTFTMGEDGADGEAPHQVTLTQPFELGVYEVTQEQYERVMGENPSNGGKGEQNPVENVSWDEAVKFCRELSALPAEQEAGYEYRLPTEAEWEYACRAGTTTSYSFGSTIAQLGDYAWFKENSDKTSHPVGQKKPNPWGLHDMHGNVFEWCQDWYGAYPAGSLTDPTGPSSGSLRVIRGGCWINVSGYCRSAHRNKITSSHRGGNLGFRVVRRSVKGEIHQNSIARKIKLQNVSFEEPRGNKGSFAFVESMPGWNTTDDELEIWSTGFEGFEAHDGDQFVELNANIDGTLYQDLTGIRRGAALDFSFAHRGRNGNDTMKLTITDFGADNTIGNEDDVVLFVKEYTTGKDAWAVYDNANESPIQALGNTVRFAYTAVHGTGGRGPDKTEGNFLDSVTFGIEVRNQPKRTFTAEQASKLLIGKLMGTPASRGRTASRRPKT